MDGVNANCFPLPVGSTSDIPSDSHQGLDKLLPPDEEPFILFLDNSRASLYIETVIQLLRGNKEQASLRLEEARGFRAVVDPMQSLQGVQELFGALSPERSPSVETMNQALRKCLCDTDIHFQPKKVSHFFERIALEEILRNPGLLTTLGLARAIGLTEGDGFLGDEGPYAREQKERRKECRLHILKKYIFDEMTPDERVTADVLVWQLQHDVEGKDFIYHDDPVNQLWGPHIELPEFLLCLHPLEREEDVHHFIDRLNGFSKIFREYRDTMERARTLGLVPPKAVIQRAIDQMGHFLRDTYEECPLFSRLKTAINDIPGLEVDQTLSRAKEALKTHAFPAFQGLHLYLRGLLAEAQETAGVWDCPNGEAYYQHVLREHTTLDLSPEEIHIIGKQEVNRVQAELEQLFGELNIPPGSFSQRIRFLYADEENYYENTLDGREACLKDFQRLLQRSRDVLGPLFRLKPNHPVEFQIAPDFSEFGLLAVRYQEPSMDGSRAGTFFINPRYMFKHGNATLAVHEGEPGHHYQLGLEAEMDIPLARKICQYSAFSEGWALYVERLALEYGFFQTPAELLGHYRDELFRSVRLIVDTGIHYYRWTREESIQFLMDNTGCGEAAAITEIERYMAFPGQACAYKLGQLQILELRECCQETLGGEFDLRDFHDLILGLGAVPLPILRKKVEEWLNSHYCKCSPGV